MARVLIIDDDRLMSETLYEMVENMSHEVDCAFTVAEGLAKLLSNPFDIIFLEVRMPDGSGLDILSRIVATSSSPEVIIITGYSDPDGAELAMQCGAWDYLRKSASTREITLSLNRALQYREQKRKANSRGNGLINLKRDAIVGSSASLKTCLELLARASDSDVNVLITGETGTGKELFARAIHENSRRADRSFVAVDCAALPENLAESILFGHSRGAFTGADKTTEGLLQMASGGTLFLDEIGELSLSGQKVFLRALQERCFRPLGGKQEIGCDFRLVSVTNRSLDDMMKEGRFREELLFRIRSMSIQLPPLRARNEDIRDLLTHYMTRYCDRSGVPTRGLSQELLDVLMTYPWPGNVRELINTLEGALVSTPGEPVLFARHLPGYIRAQVAWSATLGHKSAANEAKAGAYEMFPKLKELRKTTFDRVEKEYLKNLMTHTRGSIEKACEISGVQRARLYGLLKKHRISVSSREPASS